MVPERFVVEYPERCLTLLRMLEPMARKEHLVGSFSLLVASAVFVIPYERMQSRHPMHHKGRDGDLDRALRCLDKRENFCAARFWNGEDPGEWRFSRIMQHQNDTLRWLDEKGVHPMATGAANSIVRRKAGEVLRVVRNALAHGNVVYLNINGFEERNTKVQYLGFLSRYEESEEQKRAAETYRLVATTENCFLRFVKAWATWIASFPRDTQLSEAA
jgi:hypothetical protein